MLPVIMFLFLFAMGVMFLLVSHILAQYAAFAAARCGIVSPHVVQANSSTGDVSFRGGYKRFERQAGDIVAMVMGGMVRYFLWPGEDASRAVRARCGAVVQADSAGGAKVLRVTAFFRQPLLIPGFRIPGVGDSFTVRATASLPLVKHVAKK